jgi:hypothetical protein
VKQSIKSTDIEEQQTLPPKIRRPATNFDLFRLSHSKIEVGVSPNQLRKYFKEGLPVYRVGDHTVWISKLEFAAFIRSRSLRKELN